MFGTICVRLHTVACRCSRLWHLQTHIGHWGQCLQEALFAMAIVLGEVPHFLSSSGAHDAGDNWESGCDCGGCGGRGSHSWCLARLFERLSDPLLTNTFRIGGSQLGEALGGVLAQVVSLPPSLTQRTLNALHDLNAFRLLTKLRGFRCRHKISGPGRNHAMPLFPCET